MTPTRLSILLAAAGLAACSLRDPIIDRMSVSDSKYEADRAACKQSASPIGFGNPQADCMKAKGYTVLMQ